MTGLTEAQDSAQLPMSWYVIYFIQTLAYRTFPCSQLSMIPSIPLLRLSRILDTLGLPSTYANLCSHG